MTERIVLDSWAILAWLQGESAGAIVRDLLGWADGDETSGKRVRSRWGDEMSRPGLVRQPDQPWRGFLYLGPEKGRAGGQGNCRGDQR